MRPLTGPRARVVTITTLVGILFGLFVLDGAGWGGLEVDPVTAASATTADAAVAGPSFDGLRGILSIDRTPSKPTPREVRYKYAISALAVAWVGVRFVDSWRLDLRRIALEPRSVPVHRRFAGYVRRVSNVLRTPNPSENDNRHPRRADRRSLDHE